MKLQRLEAMDPGIPGKVAVGSHTQLAVAMMEEKANDNELAVEEIVNVGMENDTELELVVVVSTKYMVVEEVVVVLYKEVVSEVEGNELGKVENGQEAAVAMNRYRQEEAVMVGVVNYNNKEWEEVESTKAEEVVKNLVVGGYNKVAAFKMVVEMEEMEVEAVNKLAEEVMAEVGSKLVKAAIVVVGVNKLVEGEMVKEVEVVEVKEGEVAYKPRKEKVKVVAVMAMEENEETTSQLVGKLSTLVKKAEEEPAK